jgi:transcriptional regulator with XRE-family HTH domain
MNRNRPILPVGLGMDSKTLDMQQLGAVIKKRRQALGDISTHRLAANAGVADPYVRKLENGQGTRVGIVVLARIARALGTTLDDLLVEAGMMDRHETPSELNEMYSTLHNPERAALLKISRILQELQNATESRDVEPGEAIGPPTPLRPAEVEEQEWAAYDAPHEPPWTQEDSPK